MESQQTQITYNADPGIYDPGIYSRATLVERRYFSQLYANHAHQIFETYGG